ncbi:Abi family protein [Bifidobacterium samirii]|uniref:Abi family protein n=1 Tax=Bifidobacterium samirii TaxID=2306974 RepID=A0A430FJL2_9BIFI|nr:Abi family protein [Bifidobacterium samirii]
MDRAVPDTPTVRESGNDAILNGNSTPHASAHGAANQAGSFFFPMKPALDYASQVAHLRERGLVIEDAADAASWLSDTNYYRLRGYWITLERDGRFIPGTTLGDIRGIYRLDQELRLWLWHAIGPIEIKARTSLAYHLARACGPLAHRESGLFSDGRAHARSMSGYEKEMARAERGNVPCVTHNLRKYGDLPVWAAVEIMSMGTMSQLYGNLSGRASYPDGTTVSQAVSKDFDIKPYLLKSWLRHLTYVRNLCGHHSRIYNRSMTTRATMLRKDSRHEGLKAWATIVVIMRMYQRAWPGRWADMADSLTRIIDSHPDVDLKPMGFPDDWRNVLRP